MLNFNKLTENSIYMVTENQQSNSKENIPNNS